MDSGRKVPLYERFAQELEAQILAGTFPVGGRVPSIRETSLKRGISFSTVVQAYQLLENRGVLEARPQSGYYVALRPKMSVPEPDFSDDRSDPVDVSVDAVSVGLILDTLKQDYAQFGAALPDPALLPTAKLNRILIDIAHGNDESISLGAPPAGRDELRVQVAQRAFGFGCDLTPEDIIITGGCTEAFSLCLQAVCAPGDLVAVESPTYFGILLALEAQHLRALEIPSHPRSGMSLDALRFAVENHPVKAVVAMSSFSNPSGSLMSDADKEAMVELLASRGIPLIEDDINGELYFSERRPQVTKAFDRSGNVLLCSSFSKDISPGYRIGWTVPGRYFDEVLRLKMTFNIRTAALPQLAIARFLESGGYEHHLRSIRRAYARKVELLSRSVAANFPQGTRVTEPQGGFVVWLQLPQRLDSIRLYREAQKSFITLAPGYIFSPSRKFDDFIRLNAASWSDRTEGDVARLGRLVERLISGGSP